jgi:hypothetical protein
MQIIISMRIVERSERQTRDWEVHGCVSGQRTGVAGPARGDRRPRNSCCDQTKFASSAVFDRVHLVAAISKGAFTTAV